MGKKKTPSPKEQMQQVGQQAKTAYESSLTPSATETAFSPVSNQFQQQYNQAAERQTQDYGNIMGAYNQFRQNLAPPTQFRAERPAELGESFGYMREAMPGYREFASTGGYSPTDIQELRARGVSPIRAAYGNTMMELDRARALGGNAGAPNYIAALSRAQRELPGQMADAMTGVNAGLADQIRQGKLAGLAGMTGVGQAMGGLSSDEANRMLQAQGMTEQSLQNHQQMNLAGLGGQASLFGTSPGMASTFGNQALNSWQQRAAMEQARNQFGLGMMDAQLRAAGGEQQAQGPSKWATAGKAALTALPYIAMAFSSKTMKKNIRPVKNTSKFAKYLKELPLYTWQYKGDNVKHFGPIAEEFKDKFGIGDGKTLHLADVMGVMLAAGKESTKHV